MANGRYLSSTAPVSQVYTNTHQEIIQITDDKLRLILREHLAKAERKNEWQTPLGIFLAVLTVFVSSDFREGLGVPAATWRAIFMIAAVVSAGWLLKTTVLAFYSPSLDDVVKIIKNSGGESQP
jgi:hypothetical protein